MSEHVERNLGDPCKHCEHTRYSHKVFGEKGTYPYAEAAPDGACGALHCTCRMFELAPKPRISVQRIGNTLHVRNESSEAALVSGAVFGHLDEGGNLVPDEYVVHSVAHVPTFELELDPWERIEKAAAEWRNAYRAHERGDESAVMRHSSLAVAHTLKLSQGLR